MIREERVKRQIFNIDSAKRCNRLNNDDDGAEWNYVNSALYYNRMNTTQCMLESLLPRKEKKNTKFTLIFQVISIITKHTTHSPTLGAKAHKHLSISTMTTSMSMKWLDVYNDVEIVCMPFNIFPSETIHFQRVLSVCVRQRG